MKKKAVKGGRRVVKVGRPRAVVARKAPEEDGDGAPLVSAVPCPIPTDPAMGDKTPEVMSWYREHRPEEFERRYGNRVCPEMDQAVRVRCGMGGRVDDSGDGGEERGPVSDFEDEDDEVVRVKPRVIMG